MKACFSPTKCADHLLPSLPPPWASSEAETLEGKGQASVLGILQLLSGSALQHPALCPEAACLGWPPWAPLPSRFQLGLANGRDQQLVEGGKKVRMVCVASSLLLDRELS